MSGLASRAPRRDVFFLCLLTFGALVHLVVQYPSLPADVPSHFDSAGKPDDWMPKGAFVALMGVIYALTAGSFLAFDRFLPRLPDSMINLPNKEYWLAPERRSATLTDVGRRLIRLGAVSVVLVLVIAHESILVAKQEQPALHGFGLVVAAYALYTAVWCIGLIRRYRRLPPDPLAKPGNRS